MIDSTDIIARNRATVERFLAGTHSPDIADVGVIDDTVLPDIVCHGFPGGLDPHDHESYKAFFEIFRRSFSDMTFDIDAMVSDERFVSVRWRVTCVHSGTFAGIEPSGRRIRFDGMVLYRMQAGLIAETWLHIDELALLGQIGAVRSNAA